MNRFVMTFESFVAQFDKKHTAKILEHDVEYTIENFAAEELPDVLREQIEASVKDGITEGKLSCEQDGSELRGSWKMIA